MVPGSTNSWWTSGCKKQWWAWSRSFDLLILAFFWREDECVCHSDDCLSVSGSYLNAYVSSPVMTLSKNFRSHLHMSRFSWHVSTQHDVWSSVSTFGTIFAHTFRMPISFVTISWTLVFRMFNMLPIKRTLNRRSEFISSLTRVTSSAAVVVDGRPTRSSLSTSSRPS